MPSASLAVARRVHPEPARITALSAAIAVNLAIIMIALRPMAPRIVQMLETDVTPIQMLTPAAPVKPPPPIVLPHITAKVVTAIKTVVPKAIAPTDEGTVHAPPVITQPTLAPVTTTPVIATPQAKDTSPPGEVSLAYRTSPLHFPTQALRRHLQGTVLLRVLVDENGKPVDVQVEQSSGYAILDQSAREQVLASWQFQPAVVDGHASRAWARVPVSFVVNNL